MNVSRFHLSILPHLRAIVPIAALLLTTVVLTAQPIAEWDRGLGGSNWEELNSIQQTADEGYIMAGYSSSSSNGDITDPTEGLGDFWVVKMDRDGNVEWDDRYGGNGEERPYSVKQTNDGGYIIGGWSFSGISGDKTQLSRGSFDYWIVKTDANGLIEWDRTYGGAGTDILYDLIQTSDGGYLLGGNSMSDISGEKSHNSYGSDDFWVIKIDATGNIEWDRTYGGTDEERLNVILEANDGSFVLGGGTRSDIAPGTDITTPFLGVKDFWLLKVDQLTGDIIWERRYGGTDEDEISSIFKTDDGGYFIGGGSRSDRLLNQKSEDCRGIVDMWVIKTDANGIAEWDRTFGGSGLDNCYAVKQNSIGKYIIGGFSGSPADGDKTQSNLGGWDYWLIYLDNDGMGTKLWDQTIGGSSNDVMENLFQTSDGGYLMAGHSSSDVGGDKTSPNKGLNDFWIVKTQCNLSVEFRDTIVCPNEPVTLNAYDASCTDCQWRWNDNNTDSIRMVSTPVSTTYQVTLTDGVGCARFDDINITVNPSPALDLGNDFDICPETSTLIGPADPSLDYQWSTGDTTATLSVDSAATYSLIVSDAMGCTSQDAIDIGFHTPPTVDLGPDTLLCPSASIRLDAGNPGMRYRWSNNSSGQTLDVNAAGIYSVTLTDGNNCEAADTVIVDSYQLPSVNNISTNCNTDNTFYTLSFEVSGGDPGTYQFAGAGISGSFANGIFTSDPIPGGQAYSMGISDGQGCAPVQIQGDPGCVCNSEAPNIVINNFNICGQQQVTATEISPSTLDADDVLNYILHDGNNATIGTILATNTAPVFSFLPATMSYGTTYWITPLVGNDDGSGMVNTNDGCLSQGNSASVVFYDTPDAEIAPQGSLNLTCDFPSVVLDGSSSQVNSGVGQLDFAWLTDTGNIMGGTNGLAAEANAAGAYWLVVTNSMTGCRDTARVQVEAGDDLPVALIAEPEELTCLDTLMELDAVGSSTGTDYTYLWTGGNIDGFTGLNPTVDQPGIYQLLVTNTSNGCTTTASVEVRADLVQPQVSIDGTTFLDCLTSSVELEGAYTADGEVMISWNTPDGNIVEGELGLRPLVDAPGQYQLLVVSQENGCEGSAAVTVSDNPARPQAAELLVQDAPCFGEASGHILVDSVINGQEPFLFSLNNQAFSSQNEFVGLDAGEYQLAIQDVNGCEWDTLIALEDPAPFVVSIGALDTIKLGERYRFRPQSNQPLDTFFWTSSELLACPSCLNLDVRPSNTATYTFEAINEAGCTASDVATILVEKQRRVYIPTAFTPNGDGRNDRLAVFGGEEVMSINYFRIFNRWGELVYELEDGRPNDELAGWDGKFKGKLMDSGVYIYVGEIVFSDGLTRIYQGDFTLLR
ncbi:MAG: gliding motility-associated C-terminal domain-containing protein [Bacteroidota bacterium]